MLFKTKRNMITEEQIKNLTEDYKEYTKEELAFMLWCREIQLRIIKQHSFDKIIKDREEIKELMKTLKKQIK